MAIYLTRYSREYASSLIRKIKEEQRRVVLYGYTHACEMAIAGLLDNGIIPNVIYDRDPKLSGITMFGVPVMPSDEVCLEEKNTYIFIATQRDAIKLKKKLRDIGYVNTDTVLPIIEHFDYTRYATDEERDEYDPFDINSVGSTVTHIPIKQHRIINHYHNKSPFSSQDGIILHGTIRAYRYNLIAFRNIYDVENGDVSRNILTLTVAFGRKCNLKCIDCAADMQYNKKSELYSADSIDRSLKRLFVFIDFVSAIVIGGGEPFISNELVDIARVIHRYKQEGKIGKFYIVTNGGIIPNDEILQSLSKYIDYISVSDYNNLVKTREAFIKKARYFLPVNRVLGEYKIDRDGTVYEAETLWSDMGDFTLRDRTKEQLQVLSDKCNARKAVILCDGKLYNCWRCNSCIKFGIVEPNSMECADLLDEHISDDNLLASIDAVTNIYRDNVPPLQACNYCDGIYVSDLRVPAGIQSPHILSLYEKTENPDICSPTFDPTL